jgi:hypothetical protein
MSAPRFEYIIARVKDSVAFAKCDWLALEAKNFGMTHMAEREAMLYGRYNAEFIITKADPELNYGLPFKMYAHYSTAEGLRLLQRVCLTSSCISSYGLQKVDVDADTLRFDGTYYSKEGESRKGLVQRCKAYGWTLTD